MISFAPSICYLLFITGPLSLTAIFLGSEVTFEYLWLSVLVLVVLIAGDWFGSRVEKSRKLSEPTRFELSNPAYYSLVAFFLLSLLFNAILHGQIPLLDLVTNANYADTRAFHAKSSRLIYYSSYLINYCNFVVAPILLFYLAQSARRRQLMVMLPLFVFSSVFYLGSFNLMFLAIFVIGLYIAMHYRVQLYRWIIVSLLIFSAISSFEYIHNADTLRQAEGPQMLSFADFYRVRDEGGIKGILDSRIYRVFWVPSDVSAIWYRYTVEHPESTGKGYQLGYPNVIGIAYYTDRFEGKYTDDIYAFASFDVDALVRFGWPGFWLSLVGWLVFRMLIARLAVLCGCGILYSYILIGVAILLPISSLPAIALSNGFLLALLGLFLFFDNNTISYSTALRRLRIRH